MFYLCKSAKQSCEHDERSYLALHQESHTGGPPSLNVGCDEHAVQPMLRHMVRKISSEGPSRGSL